MKASKIISFLGIPSSILALRPHVFQARWTPPMIPNPPTMKTIGHEALSAATSTTSNQTFKQLIDHDNPSAGTFAQRWWYSSKYWKQGGPIVLMTPGESDASGFSGYLDIGALTGVIAKDYGGAVIILEHRYFGTSFPVPDLSTYNMRYLNLHQSLEDLVYFAQNVNLPFSSSSKPNQVPWILVGGSYSGTLAAYAKKLYGDLFWISYSTSAPLQPIENFWQYYEPVQLGMASNCSADAASAIAYVDSVLTGSDARLKSQLRQQFGVTTSQLADDDFAAALGDTGPSDWQDNTAYTGYTAFYAWCDTLEKGNSKSTGLGTTTAVQNYATWFKEYIASSCGPTDADLVFCFDTHSPTKSFYTDVSYTAGNGWRSWMWMVCSQFGWFQTGEVPSGTTTIVSKLMNQAYFQNQCNLMFPSDSRNPYNLGTAITNITAQFGGWTLKANRLWITNAQFDPWRSASYASDYGPKSPSTDSEPTGLIPNGIHCWDLLVENWNDDPSLVPVVTAAITKIGVWLKEFAPKKSGR